jgi:hypothetical protein
MMEMLDLKSAQAWGLGRPEFMRREAIVKKSCKLDSYWPPGEVSSFDIYGEKFSPTARWRSSRGRCGCCERRGGRRMAGQLLHDRHAAGPRRIAYEHRFPLS